MKKLSPKSIAKQRAELLSAGVAFAERQREAYKRLYKQCQHVMLTGLYGIRYCTICGAKGQQLKDTP